MYSVLQIKWKSEIMKLSSIIFFSCFFFRIHLQNYISRKHQQSSFFHLLFSAVHLSFHPFVLHSFTSSLLLHLLLLLHLWCLSLFPHHNDSFHAEGGESERGRGGREYGSEEGRTERGMKGQRRRRGKGGRVGEVGRKRDGWRKGRPGSELTLGGWFGVSMMKQ